MKKFLIFTIIVALNTIFPSCTFAETNDGMAVIAAREEYRQEIAELERSGEYNNSVSAEFNCSHLIQVYIPDENTDCHYIACKSCGERLSGNEPHAKMTEYDLDSAMTKDGTRIYVYSLRCGSCGVIEVRLCDSLREEYGGAE